MALNYDLHAHSIASDGSLTPTQLVELARCADVDVLALTDHDVTDGLQEARLAARQQGIRLIPGVEVSVTWKGATIHVLGLAIDTACDELQQGLRKLRDFRAWRAEEIARRLEKNGIHGALQGAKHYATGSLISRTHFAHYLVDNGYAKNLQAVFKRFLVHNKPGYVPGEWATLEQAVQWITQAGGLPVIAHPARYRLTASKLRQLLQAFKECGGIGLEVVSSSHSEAECLTMAQFANQFELLASRGSDYHGPKHAWVELGKIAPLPADCQPIWSAWQ